MVIFKIEEFSKMTVVGFVPWTFDECALNAGNDLTFLNITLVKKMVKY